jgi:hypothetical protein
MILGFAGGLNISSEHSGTAIRSANHSSSCADQPG